MKRDILLRSASGPYSPPLSDYANEIVRLRKAAAAWKAAAKGWRQAAMLIDQFRAEDLEVYRDLLSFYRSRRVFEDTVECPYCSHLQRVKLSEYYDVGTVDCQKCGARFTVERIECFIESPE